METQNILNSIYVLIMAWNTGRAIAAGYWESALFFLLSTLCLALVLFIVLPFWFCVIGWVLFVVFAIIAINLI